VERDVKSKQSNTRRFLGVQGEIGHAIAREVQAKLAPMAKMAGFLRVRIDHRWRLCSLFLNRRKG
jgi:hypothetical protein